MGWRWTALAAAAVAGLLHAPPAPAQIGESYARVSFYFAAHEDDWQLFMNPSAFHDVADGRTKTVFVHLTAGDAGLGTGTGGRKHPYYLARERGAESAIRFMADTRGYPGDRVVAPAKLNGHRLHRVRYRNTVAYFLRLPDGHGSGSGFAGTGHQSMERLAEGEIGALTPIDGSTIYRNWTDLVVTLRAILDHERARAPLVEINVAELDPALNPHDHSDHRMTARAALDAAQGLTCASRRHFVEYASARLPENLSAEDRELEASVVAVTAAGILALDHPGIWQAYHRSYLGRNYFRFEPGSGHCDAPAPEVASAAKRVQLKP
jgi:hypothetical protein